MDFSVKHRFNVPQFSSTPSSDPTKLSQMLKYGSSELSPKLLFCIIIHTEGCWAEGVIPSSWISYALKKNPFHLVTSEKFENFKEEEVEQSFRK